MDKIVAVDPGKFEIKAGVLTQKGPQTLSYPSRLYALKNNEHFDSQGESKFITYDGHQYIIGEQGVDVDMSLAKSTILHKIGVMAALSDVVEEGDNVRLVLGCPASIYKNKDTRKQYKDYITDAGMLTFQTAEKKFDITIASTLVLPEAGGTPFMFPEIFKNSRVAVVDLGGLNLNFAVFNNGVVDITSMNTENHGGYVLENEIKSVFGGHYNCMLRQDDIRHIMEIGGMELNGTLDQASTGLLKQIYLQFIEEIPNIVKSFNYDLSLMKVVFIGGTSQLLGNLITEVIPHAVVGKDLKWVNVLGFLKIAEQKYSGR